MTGLVVEGGASRTYFALGVMDVMMKNNLTADYIGGASAGISNALNFASGQIGRGMTIGEKYVPDKRYCSFRNFLNPKNRSLFGIDFVFREIPDKLVPYDYDALKNFSGMVEATVTNVRTGKSEYLPVPADSRGWNVLVASCALPIMFPMVEINGEKYMDGGISDSIPYRRAFDMGCDRVVVILSRERGYTKKIGSEKAAARIFRKYPKFAESLLNRPEMYNRERSELFELEKEGKALVIEPKDTRGWKRTECSAEKLRQMYNEGVKTTNSKLDELKKFLNE